MLLTTEKETDTQDKEMIHSHTHTAHEVELRN